MMKIKVLLPTMLLATQLHAALIDLGPNRSSFSAEFSFDELNGTDMAHHVSLDLMFNTSVHVFRGTDVFAMGLKFFTPTPDFITGTAEVLGVTMPVGSATSDAGFSFIAMFPLEFGINKPVDFNSVHFELDIPVMPITDGEFFISALDLKHSEPFRIGPHVPDNGSTMFLLILALIGLKVYDKKTTS